MPAPEDALPKPDHARPADDDVLTAPVDVLTAPGEVSGGVQTAPGGVGAAGGRRPGLLVPAGLRIGSLAAPRPATGASEGAGAGSGLGHAALKRGFDVAFAVTFLVVALPFLVLLAVALQVDSPGRLLFVQRRIGRDGHPFDCIKLRTMREDAEAVLAQMLERCPEARREWARDHKLRDDPRVSRLGRIVRKLSLDEIPQLINVLRGEMSVVGPRPIVAEEIPRYGEHFADYCRVRPGLTGLWQVSGRNDVSYAARVALDRDYARQGSFLLDLAIVARTVPAVLGARGSY